MVFSAIHYICPLPTPNSTSNSTCCTSWHLSLTAWETLSRLQPHLFSTQTYQITAIRSPLPSLLWDLQLKFKAGRKTMYKALLSLQSFRASLGGQVMVLPALYPREPSGRSVHHSSCQPGQLCSKPDGNAAVAQKYVEKEKNPVPGHLDCGSNKVARLCT